MLIGNSDTQNWILPPWIIALLMLFGIVGVWAIYRSDQDWEKYSKEHGCVVVAVVDAKTGMVGDKTIYIPGSTTYACDEGRMKVTR
jgi:hypothetical protein